MIKKSGWVIMKDFLFKRFSDYSSSVKGYQVFAVLVPQSPLELKRAEKTHSLRENVLWVADHFLETPRKWDTVFLKV